MSSLDRQVPKFLLTKAIVVVIVVILKISWVEFKSILTTKKNAYKHTPNKFKNKDNPTQINVT